MDLIQQIIHAITVTHPPHLLVVHFPIALTGAALFFILLALWRKSDVLEKIAFADIALASVSTIVAGFLGVRDNAVFYNGNATNANTKIVLAIILLIITATTALARWKYPNLFQMQKTRVIYVLAYFVSFAIASVLGFLGGVIIYGF
jgi:uncharacterized membrane protein